MAGFAVRAGSTSAPSRKSSSNGPPFNTSPLPAAIRRAPPPRASEKGRLGSQGSPPLDRPPSVARSRSESESCSRPGICGDSQWATGGWPQHRDASRGALPAGGGVHAHRRGAAGAGLHLHPHRHRERARRRERRGLQEPQVSGPCQMPVVHFAKPPRSGRPITCAKEL